MWSLGCKALCNFIILLILWFIWWSFSLVNFKNCFTYVSWTAHVFIPFIRFLLYSLVSSSFLILQRYIVFYFFFHRHIFNHDFFYLLLYDGEFIIIFHRSTRWWFLTGVRVTASHLKSLGLLIIQADLNNAVVWILSARPLIPKSSTLCTIPYVTVRSARITTGIHDTCSITFQFKSKVLQLISLFAFLQFYPVVRQNVI